ncbi:hypothetical protein HK104_000477 [Borealophlyctis nickersoniae]|nr:hypothetical protein HK104_000477 [Borealophlyctis nickersoniae]
MVRCEKLIIPSRDHKIRKIESGGVQKQARPAAVSVRAPTTVSAPSPPDVPYRGMQADTSIFRSAENVARKALKITKIREKYGYLIREDLADMSELEKDFLLDKLPIVNGRPASEEFMEAEIFGGYIGYLHQKNTPFKIEAIVVQSPSIREWLRIPDRILRDITKGRRKPRVPANKLKKLTKEEKKLVVKTNSCHMADGTQVNEEDAEETDYEEKDEEEEDDDDDMDSDSDMTDDEDMDSDSDMTDDDGTSADDDEMQIRAEELEEGRERKPVVKVN